MSNYPALQSAVAKNNPDAMKELLSTMPMDERIELFNMALKEENFLIIDSLLQWDPDLKSHLISLIDGVAIKNYPLDILAMLVDYGADLNQTIGDTTLLGMIHQSDPDVAFFLQGETKNLQQLHKIFNADILKKSKPQAADPRDQFINFAVDFFVNSTLSAKVCNTMSIYMALAGYGPLNEQTELILALTQKGDAYLSTESLALLNAEINFAYSLYSEFPYYSKHTNNLISRLKNLGLSLKTTLSPGVESPLIQELEAITDAYERKVLQTINAQSWLIKPTEAIKEQADVQLENIGGQCFGFAYMIKQAMDVGELVRCKKRIEWIQSIPIEQLKDILQKNRESMLSNHQQGIKPSEIQLEHLELEAYIAGTAFAQRPSIHPISDINDPILNLSAILMSKKLEAEGGLVQIKTMTHYYNHADLLTYLHTLRQVINAAPPSCDFVSLFLSCPAHIIVVGYEIKRCKWVFCDANARPQIQYIDSVWLLAEKIIFALSMETQNTMSQITTTVYCTKNQEETLGAIFTQWEAHPQLTVIHNIERQQSLQTRMPFLSVNSDSLELAIASGNVTLAQFALRGVNINAKLMNGKTPLITAIEGENIAMVQFLIGVGADVNNNGLITDPVIELNYPLEHPSLTTATYNKTPDIIKLLLNSMVQCNANQITFLLHTIISRNKIDHFKALLKHAKTGVKEELLKDTIFLYVVKNQPIECRSDYILCDEVQEYLLSWIEDFDVLEDLLNSLPTEKRALFLQQFSGDSLLKWIKDSYQLRALIKLLPKNEVEAFLQLFIEQLFTGDVQSWFKRGYGLPDLCEIIKISPTKVAPFLQQFFNQYFDDEAQLRATSIHILHRIIECIPSAARYFFLQQKNIRNLFMQCNDNGYYLGLIITLLAEEHVLPFLQQYLSADMFETYISFRLPEIISSLPEQELVPFLQQKIVQDKLIQYMNPLRKGEKNDITDIINVLPEELIDLFFEQHQANIQKWIADPGNLSRMLPVLPQDKICPLIAQHIITSPKLLTWDAMILLKRFNNEHQDIVVECFSNIPELLQAIDNKAKVYQIIGDSTSCIDQDVFIENLVRIIQLQENSNEGVLARFKPYEDIQDLWLYNSLVRVYQRNQQTSQTAIRSDRQQHSFFADDRDDQNKNTPIILKYPLS
jgi:hypothetical protein